MSRLRSVSDLVSQMGSFAFEVPAGQFKATVVTEGASIRLEVGGVTHVLASGRGGLQVQARLDFPGLVTVVGDTGETLTTLAMVADRDSVPGWEDGPSFTQLELKSRDTVSPEVRQALDAMERNFRVREAALVAEIQRLGTS